MMFTIMHIVECPIKFSVLQTVPRVSFVDLLGTSCCELQANGWVNPEEYIMHHRNQCWIKIIWAPEAQAFTSPFADF